MQGFDDERLDVYVAALDFVTTADALAKAASRGYGDLADQLRRALASMSPFLDAMFGNKASPRTSPGTSTHAGAQLS